jgi:pimeloyl-ACP methyl ester carboxylesterase
MLKLRRIWCIALPVLVSASLQAPADEAYPEVKRSTGLIERGGDQVYFESCGEGDAIVLCHGLGGNHAIWFQQVAALAPKYRIITWDQRGFGRSTNNEARSLGPSTAADDLEALLDNLHIERAHLVGQSMGGWTVLGFTLEHPERVRSLVLADTIGGIYTPEIQQAFLAYLTRSRASAPPDGQYPLGRHPALAAELVNRDPAKAFLYQQIGSFPSPPASAIGPLLIATKYDLDRLKQLQTPTLFIVGSDDPIFPPTMIRQAAEEVSGSVVREIPDSGHSPYFERPEEWNAAVLEFVGAH